MKEGHSKASQAPHQRGHLLLQNHYKGKVKANRNQKDFCSMTSPDRQFSEMPTQGIFFPPYTRLFSIHRAANLLSFNFLRSTTTKNTLTRDSHALKYNNIEFESSFGAWQEEDGTCASPQPFLPKKITAIFLND